MPMAADYWTSTQHLHWEDPTAELWGPSNNASQSAAAKFPLPELRYVNVFLQQQASKLGKRLNTRQPVIATTVIFVRRFYAKVDIFSTNPYLVVATAFYLACKIEECPQHIKTVVAEARTLWADLVPSDTAKLGQCEFRLVSEINAHLIVHHPYRSLTELEERLGLSQEEMALAWSVINDHYATNLALRYPPHVIASMAVVLTLIARPSQAANATAASRFLQGGVGQVNPAALTEAIQRKGSKLKDWLAVTDMDVEALMDCMQHIISLYVLMEKYSEKDVKDKIARFVKGQGLDQWAG